MTRVEEIEARFLAALHGAGGPGGRRGAGQLSVACVRVLPVTRAAIMIWTGGGGWEVLGGSDPQATDDAQLQAAAGEGPGPQAYQRGAPVLVPDVDAALGAGRWPLLAAAGLARRCGGIFSFPLQLGAIRLGALDLSTDTPTTLDTAEFAAAAHIAELITVVLLAAKPVPRSGTPDDHRTGTDRMAGVVTGFGDYVDGLESWWEPAESSREIHQATGMIAVQLGSDIATAYARLVGHALAVGRPIGQVAAEVVARRQRFDPGDDVEPGPDRS